MVDTSRATPSGTEHLSETECWWLLSRAEVGRLGVAALGTVEIFPVNFVVDQKRIIFRTSPGEKLLALTMRNTVAFEIDGWDEASAWSVLVKGKASALDTDDAIRAASHTGVKPWTPDPKNTFVQIQPSEVTGRRFARGHKAETIWYW